MKFDSYPTANRRLDARTVEIHRTIAAVAAIIATVTAIAAVITVCIMAVIIETGKISDPYSGMVFVPPAGKSMAVVTIVMASITIVAASVATAFSIVVKTIGAIIAVIIATVTAIVLLVIISVLTSLTPRYPWSFTVNIPTYTGIMVLSVIALIFAIASSVASARAASITLEEIKKIKNDKGE